MPEEQDYSPARRAEVKADLGGVRMLEVGQAETEGRQLRVAMGAMVAKAHLAGAAAAGAAVEPEAVGAARAGALSRERATPEIMEPIPSSMRAALAALAAMGSAG